MRAMLFQYCLEVILMRYLIPMVEIVLPSVKLLGNGFVDAYRSLHPDVKKYPSYTHMEGVRIDQIYYKGKGLKNTFTEVISTWKTGFPSDHFLIVSKFELDY